VLQEYQLWTESVTIEGLITPELRQKVVEYLNLCSKEYMWVKKGRIPTDIWESWKNGIKANLANPVIQSIYNEEQAKWRYSYYGFFEAMKRN
jgi:hypothetical protein